MRNFIFFIRRFFNLILFVALEVVCIVMIQRTNTLQGNDIVSSANAVSGLVYKKRDDVVYYFGLKKMNDSLLTENALLRQQIEQIRGLDTLGDTTVQVRSQVGDSSKHVVRYSDYVYRTARVINNSTNATDNYITINRGSKHGIMKNMAVLSGTGVVGRVEHVSANYASVLSVLSAKQKVSARVKNSNGFVVWESKDPHLLTMIDVPSQVNVKKGDSVYTNNYSLYFPANVLIGRVMKVEVIKKTALLRIYLRSSTDFANLQYVYVVENKMNVEKKELEDSVGKK